MFRQICHIVHGRLVWLKWKRRFRLDHRKVLLVLTGENEQIDKYALLHLKDYMRRKVADRAVILASDRKIWKQAAAFASCFPVKAYLVKEQERGLRETDVDEEEAVCLGLYCLRSADREGRG